MGLWDCIICACKGELHCSSLLHVTRMPRLAEIHRPSTALIKFVEAIGILIGSQVKSLKTRYRTPLPSNYSETIHHLSNNYDEIYKFISALDASALSNELSQQLYAKTQERGFHYGNALAEISGDLIESLFAAVIRVLNALSSSDNGRIRVQGANVLIPMTGNKSSYAALDIGMHLLGHGLCFISAYVDESFLGMKSEQTLKYLTRDVERRCSNQFKLSSDKMIIDATIAQNGEDIRLKVEETLLSAGAPGVIDILCVGLEDTNIGLNGASPLLMWAAWSAPVDVLLARTNSPIRPFSSLQMTRTVLIHYHLPSSVPPLDVVEQSLRFIRPADFVLFVVSGERRTSRGDNQETRFDYGRRYNQATATAPPTPSYCYHTDDKALEECAELLQSYLTHAQAEGDVRVIRDIPAVSIAQQLVQISSEEHADLLVVKRSLGSDNERNRCLIVDCARDAPCSLVILK